MARFFLPRTWRLKQVVFFLMIFELPFTVANLALFGIASPNLYRTILWRLGGEMGFNSSPQFVLYKYANYQPVTLPIIWSSFNTQFHLVIGVVCTFFWLIKFTMWLLKVFLPIFSLLLHIPLLILWSYGIYMQTAPDTIDPAHQRKGAPWYITENCNIVQDKLNRGYCMQAKSAFAVTVIMIMIYAAFVLLTIHSLIPTAEAKHAHATKQAEKKAEREKWAASSPTDNEMTAEEQWQHMWELQQLPRTPGLKSPVTPRTRSFHDLEAGQYANLQLQPEYGAYYPGNGGGVAVQEVQHAGISPVEEHGGYVYPHEYPQDVKGKQHAGSAY